MTQIFDQAGRSTVAAAEGDAALSVGDTQRAREMYAEAGEILEREMRSIRDGETVQLLRFLAASQFYRGGHYRRALDLAEKIRESELPAGSQHLLPRFMRDVKDRATSVYEARELERLQTLWTAKDYAGIIATLQEHPYVLSPADLAFVRAVCCETLGKYRPAVLFFANAYRRSQNNPAVLAALAPLPLNLPGQGRLQEAWEYVQAQLELFPNAVSYALASILCNKRARQAEGDARVRLYKEQAQYFDRAREEFARLPAGHQCHPEIKEVMGLGYEVAVLALHRSGNEQAAQKMCEAAIAFDPTSPGPWTIKGLITAARAEEAGTFFRKAVELGDRTYLPYSSLAYDALLKQEYREALDWSRQALERVGSQDSEVQSYLYQWSAISLDQMGAPREEIEHFFRKAIEVAPGNQFARDNYQRFQSAEHSEAAPLAVRTTAPPPQEVATLSENQVALRFPPTRNVDEVQRKLKPAA
jgi:tetratricopeptide (TPR) repeat protein